MAFSSAATVVVANQFNLIDPNGIIIATLGTSAAGANNLNFLHNDPLTSDSFLHWSKVGELAAGVEELRLSGPKTTGVPGGGPQMAFVGGPAGNQLIELDTGDTGGGFSTGLQLDGLNRQLNTFANVEPVSDVNGGVRGNRYGTTFQQAIYGGGAFNSNIAPQNVLTINIPAAPIAGAWLDISWGIDITTLLANFTASDIVINGTGFNPQIFVNGAPIGLRLNLGGRMVIPNPAAIGVALTINARIFSGANNAATVTGAATSFLTVIWNR